YLEPAHDWVDQSVESRARECIDLLATLNFLDETMRTDMQTRLCERADRQRKQSGLAPDPKRSEAGRASRTGPTSAQAPTEIHAGGAHV
ncbi:hypothetical protein WSK_1778, partial [Novosphingobium sp. Rr 2-17]|uniref:hypothetical protein n=1 Tax=Novosphingobium sp. Rr 2-17 TaxID=555793 RepID=UPI000269A801